MIEGPIFIGAVVIAVTQLIKFVAPKVSGAVTILVAGLVGLAIALIDIQIGVVDLLPAEGIMIGLGAVGAVTLTEKVGK